MSRLVGIALLSILAIPELRPLAAPSVPNDARAIEHALARLTYGQRPGDAAEVQRMGLGAWIERQLAPSAIDDGVLETRLARFETLTLDVGTLLREYHRPAVQERRMRQRSRQQAETASPPESMEGATERPRAALGPMSDLQRRDRQVIVELEEAKLLRAIYSERQLEAVLVDFWFNHFNVFAGKGPTRALVTSFERDAIRPYVLGDFRQMLEAVAASPAMLIYLDNAQSTGERTEVQSTNVQSTGVQSTEVRRRGLNENYARELVELHTLGVDGGYTQNDIVNIARAFTGWTFRPRQESGFVFAPRLHDNGEKVVLGRTIKPGGGIQDGRQVLDLLAAHPSTARFIATKLAQKFVSDVPPPALVERAARRFADTRGNLREVTRVIVTSPEFFAKSAYRAKVKTPLEFVVSAIRATGAEVRTALPLVRVLRDLGMPPYFCQPPTGYDETAETWVSSGALVSRMNFAVELGANRLRGIAIGTGPRDAIDARREQVIRQVLPGELSQSTRETIHKAATVEQIVALAVGSPEFQRQ